jgi:hypothetical protein
MTGYRIVINFRKLNKATRKDHYPLPFIDQMLERLSKHTHFCFLDGYSGFSQIAMSQEDQEKKLLLLALLEPMLIDICILVYVMDLLPFKDAWLLYSLILMRKLLRYSWMIFLFMGLILMTTYATLTKFSRDVNRLI